MNSIVHVGDGDGLYREQWNPSGDRRVSIVLRDLNPRPQAVLFNRLIPINFLMTYEYQCFGINYERQTENLPKKSHRQACPLKKYQY
jgi:hypothetical protein